MASPAPSVDAGGDDKPPETAPGNLTSLDPPADPQRNGEPPASPSAPVQSSGEDDTSPMGMTEDPVSALAEFWSKRPLPSRRTPCPTCTRRMGILRGVDPGPRSDDKLSASPTSPVPGMGTELADSEAARGANGSPSATPWCARCEHRKKFHRDRRLRRKSEVPAPPPESFMPMPMPIDDVARHALEQKVRARAAWREKKRPLPVEQERGYRECDVGKKLMRHKWDGLHHKWAGLRWDSASAFAGFGAPSWARELREKILHAQKALGVDDAPPQGPQKEDSVRDLLEKMMRFAQEALPEDGAKLVPPLGAQEGLFGDSAPGMAGFGAADGGRDLLDLEDMMLFAPKRLRVDDVKFAPPQGAQKGLRRDSALEMSGFGAPAGRRDLLDFENMMLFGQKGLCVDDAKFSPPQGVQKGLRRDSALEMSDFGAPAGRRDLLENMMLFGQKGLRVDDVKLAPTQGAQNLSSSAAARVDALLEKLAQMTKVLPKVLHEGSVLQVSAKLMRLLCPDVGSSAAAGGGLGRNDWRLVEQAIDNLVNQTGEGMQDIVKTVIPKVFSKEILYELIVACVGRYPKLFEDDKGKLTTAKHEQYQKQLDLLVNLTTAYDNDPENFPKIMKLMCKIGGCGPLPSQVIDDISPGLDPGTMEQLYSGMLELLHNVVDTNPSSK